MPSRVPTQNTRAPRETSFAATARPGNTWPPVPPVVIITVAVMDVARSYRESPEQAPVLPIDAQQDRDRDAVRDDAAAAEGQQRQREALGGQHAHVHAHVDERLHAE